MQPVSLFGFRHLFRHAYGVELDPALTLKEIYADQLELFTDFLQSLAQGMDLYEIHQRGHLEPCCDRYRLSGGPEPDSQRPPDTDCGDIQEETTILGVPS